ncbi:GreA/GreB family elongation factor [Devosia rhodophyticola]|uniref:GreA/GreB family elongation factor n=1 Tax=Devosia rhodophyticola TaxID=3026423 RepID=A0ABY7Z0Z2_9HYPH|nr:GreA/GreB family elongation factor [Devosia rhodophyticola]WDR07259.1 GreA/GreB family elongation factor [Devosia rhodophyticola]
MGFFDFGLPPIVVGEADRHDLVVLALGGVNHSADEADDLLYELDRARVISDRLLPHDVVRMGSAAVASIDGGEPQILRLAFPGENPPNSISIFSAFGTAILGLRAGQTMKWTNRNGKAHEVVVHSVRNEEHV